MGRQGEPPASAELLSFLIADIRGYTSFTQSRGDEAAAELAGKFALVAREGIEAHGGRLLELRGDEALAVFTSARASLRAAVALQEVFADETRVDPGLPLTVGIGLDAGEVVPVEGGYRGGAINLAARLCSLAKAGEALASEGVTHLARAVEGITVTRVGDGGGQGSGRAGAGVRVDVLGRGRAAAGVRDVERAAGDVGHGGADDRPGRGAAAAVVGVADRPAGARGGGGGAGSVGDREDPVAVGGGRGRRPRRRGGPVLLDGGGRAGPGRPAQDAGARAVPVLVAVDDVDAGAEAVAEVLAGGRVVGRVGRCWWCWRWTRSTRPTRTPQAVRGWTPGSTWCCGRWTRSRCAGSRRSTWTRSVRRGAAGGVVGVDRWGAAAAAPDGGVVGRGPGHPPAGGAGLPGGGQPQRDRGGGVPAGRHGDRPAAGPRAGPVVRAGSGPARPGHRTGRRTRVWTPSAPRTPRRSSAASGWSPTCWPGSPAVGWSAWSARRGAGSRPWSAPGWCPRSRRGCCRAARTGSPW